MADEAGAPAYLTGDNNVESRNRFSRKSQRRRYVVQPRLRVPCVGANAVAVQVVVLAHRRLGLSCVGCYPVQALLASLPVLGHGIGNFPLRRRSHRERGLTKRCSQPLAGVRPEFSMINARSFQAQLVLTSGG